MVGDDALIDRAVGQVELAACLDQHGAVAGAAGVGQHVGVQHQRGNHLDGAVVGEVAGADIEIVLVPTVALSWPWLVTTP